VMVSTLGRATFAGVLADGSKVTQSAALSRDGAWPFFVSLSKGQGAVLSWLSFSDRPTDDIHGQLSWIRNPNPLAKMYPGGIDIETMVVGSRFTMPLDNSLLRAPGATLAFEGGNLASSFQNQIQIAVNNQVMNLGGNPLSLVFTPTKGTFKGKVTAPGTTTSYVFGGVVLQKTSTGYGYLTGPNLTSAVSIAP
jgi:hypothetical protein